MSPELTEARGEGNARQTLDAAMSEAELFESVRAHLKAFHWMHFHTYDSRRSNPGFPDIIAVKPGRLLVIELKAERGRLTGEQELWLHELKLAGAEPHVWHPSDLSSGLIERVLRGLPTDCRCPNGYPQTRDGRVLHTGNCPLPDSRVGAGHG